MYINKVHIDNIHIYTYVIIYITYIHIVIVNKLEM